ncbi:MAG: hypothetical protein A3J48_04170 [Candidatus Doudnabacteria bacterium RIFCSPHIGHO2_02_FULL_46_11]|nr:MAG: hypothetical protein A3J48_04170 [Candidatus Doudnabacteria bacterium RIFCSPHIGHO2_02_FULL_46_11]
MRDFNRGGSRGSDRGGPGGGRRFGGGGDFRREMHPAVCSNCGKNCEVPFRPTGEKPVFCNECFRKDSGDSRPREKQGPNYQSQFDALNQKLDTILNLISAQEKPKAKKKAVVVK